MASSSLNWFVDYGQSPRYPVNSNPEQQDLTITDGKMGNFNFKNQIEGEPLDLVSLTLHTSWGINIDSCKVCGEGPFAESYEVTFEWGDTKKYEYISEVCSRCLNIINREIVRNGTKKIY